MRTRTLSIIGAATAAAGFLIAVASLHPATPVGALRAGLVLMVASCPIISAATTRRAAAVPREMLDAAHNAGWREGALHCALGLLDTPPDGGTTCPTTPTAYAHRHLRAVSGDDYERTTDQ